MSEGKYHVTSDGKLIPGVKILDPLGNDITSKVRAFMYRHEVGSPGILTLELFGAEIDVTSFANNTERTYIATGK